MLYFFIICVLTKQGWNLEKPKHGSEVRVAEESIGKEDTD